MYYNKVVAGARICLPGGSVNVKSPMLDSQPDSSIAIFLDLLLPGDADWPKATMALADPGTFLAAVSEAEGAWIRWAAAQIEAHPPAARIAAMQVLEQQEGVMFTSVLHAVYRAYYATEAVRTAALRLAEAGPLERSSLFDNCLLTIERWNR